MKTPKNTKKPRLSPRPNPSKAAQDGLRRLIDAVPISTLLQDPAMKEAAEWVMHYLQWFQSPEQVESRARRGASIRAYMAAHRKGRS